MSSLNKKYLSIITKILDKHNDWSSIVIGDEPRDKLDFNHSNLKKLGFVKHSEILKLYPSIKKAKNIINWRPKISFEKGLTSTIKYYSEQGI